MVSEIWTEKYRPSNFLEVVGQDDIVKRVEALTNSQNIPHLLFAGPAGIGKSTLALVIVKHLYKEKWRENYLELNASDERGIQIVREKVKTKAMNVNTSNTNLIFLFTKTLSAKNQIKNKTIVQEKAKLLGPAKVDIARTI
jgi:replication factor C small subunit